MPKILIFFKIYYTKGFLPFGLFSRKFKALLGVCFIKYLGLIKQWELPFEPDAGYSAVGKHQYAFLPIYIGKAKCFLCLI